MNCRYIPERRMSEAEQLKRIGARVRQIRLRLGVTQQALADRAHISKTAIWSFEKHGMGCQLATLLAIANGLGVDVLDFFVSDSEKVA